MKKMEKISNSSMILIPFLSYSILIHGNVIVLVNMPGILKRLCEHDCSGILCDL